MDGKKLGPLFRLMVSGLVVVCLRLRQTGAVNLRLVDGAEGEGRVEVFHGGTWGTVCRDGWTDENSRTVCRQLNWAGGERLSTNTSDVRLVGGGVVSEGRVEIRHDEEWGTVCDDTWHALDANVVCQQLGYLFGDARLGGDFPSGSGPIWLSGVDCEGTESSLGGCPHADWGTNGCTHQQDASVICSTLLPNIRLANGATASEGRVEIFHQGAWGTVCDDDWDDLDAHVVCYALGYHCGIGTIEPHFGEGTGPIYMGSVGCRGHESHLMYCGHDPLQTHTCHHFEDAGVECFSTACDSAPHIDNAQKVVTGRTVTYACDTGYVFHDGSRTMTFTCLCSGDWTAVAGYVCYMDLCQEGSSHPPTPDVFPWLRA